MTFFYDEILAGLSEIPVSGNPGCLLVIGENAQAILTNENSNDVFLAACEYESGRIFVSAHTCYGDWLHKKNQKTKLQSELMDNITKWLTRSDAVVDDDDILDINSANIENKELTKYKIVKWVPHGKAEISKALKNKLIEFLKNGGSLFCSVTTWAYLNYKKGDELNQHYMFQFLKKHAGIVMTNRAITAKNPLSTSKNKASRCNLTSALSKLRSNMFDSVDTINTVIGFLKELNSIIEPDQEMLQAIKQTVLEQCDEKQVCPTKDKPVKGSDEKLAAQLLCYCYLSLEGEKAPGVDYFPDDFDSPPKLLDDVEIRLHADFQERISTGFYLPAGIKLEIEVIDGDCKNWNVRIGSHTDNLTQSSEYQRWPVISFERSLRPKSTISSSFGGLIYLESKRSADITVKLSNVVKSPHFDLKKQETVDEWESTGCRSPGLWAEVAGEFLVITVPSSSVRKLTVSELTNVMQFWDEVIECHHELRGTNPKKQRRERIVCDKQISCGYMHSGYPIMTHMDLADKKNANFIFNHENLRKTGSWGLFHELGHNMQRSEWTFEGCVEVTVNLFSLHAMESVVGIPLLEQDFLAGKGKQCNYRSYFKKEPSYKEWSKKCELALYTFAQLIKHFGWDSMKKFMRTYEEDMKEDKSALPTQNQDKIDQWVIRYSKIVNRNIKQQFELWGLPVSNKVDEKVGHLDDWCPKNEIDVDEFFKPCA